MENKKETTSFLIKKSKDRLIKALDGLGLIVEKKLNLVRSVKDDEIIKLKKELEECEAKNSDLATELERTANSYDKTKTVTENIVHELDDTINNLEKILKERHADN